MAAPPVRIFATAPGTELALIPTVAAFGFPSYVTGELFTASVAVGVALPTVILKVLVAVRFGLPPSLAITCTGNVPT